MTHAAPRAALLRRTFRAAVWASACAVVGLALTACGGGDDGAGTDASDTDGLSALGETLDTDTVNGPDVQVVPAPPSSPDPAEPGSGSASGGTDLQVEAGETLREGSEGERVRQLQQALTELGYDTGGADGDYGSKTVSAVTAFQEAEGLEADGIAGAATVAAINTALAEPRG